MELQLLSKHLWLKRKSRRPSSSAFRAEIYICYLLVEPHQIDRPCPLTSNIHPTCSQNPKNECYWFRLVPYQRRHASTSQPAKPPSPRGFPSLSESEQESASDTANCWAFLAFCYLCAIVCFFFCTDALHLKPEQVHQLCQQENVGTMWCNLKVRSEFIA